MSLSRAGDSAASEADRILEQVIAPALESTVHTSHPVIPPFPPAPAKAAIAVQSIRFADHLNNDLETNLSFERYPGDLTPPPASPIWISRDLHGHTNLSLKEMRVRVSGGDYDLYLKVKGDGAIGLDRIMKGGRNITSIAKDALEAKIKEDPALYGTLSAAALAGAAVAAHEYAKKTGEPIEFGVLSQTLVSQGNVSVKGRLKAEFTGDDRVIRPSQAELAMRYRTERTEAYASARYRIREDEWEATLGSHHRLNKNVNVTTGAFYRPSDHGVFVGVSASW